MQGFFRLGGFARPGFWAGVGGVVGLHVLWWGGRASVGRRGMQLPGVYEGRGVALVRGFLKYVSNFNGTVIQKCFKGLFVILS